MSDEQTVVSRYVTPLVERAGSMTPTDVARWVMSLTLLGIGIGVWVRPEYFVAYAALGVGALALSRTVGYFDESSEVERKMGVYPETVLDEEDVSGTCIDCEQELAGGQEARSYDVVYFAGYEIFRKHSVTNFTCSECLGKDDDSHKKPASSAEGLDGVIDSSPDRNDSPFTAGKVEFFNESGGYGFIGSGSVEEDVFFHTEDVGVQNPSEGDRVEFQYTSEEKGLVATSVRCVEKSRERAD